VTHWKKYILSCIWGPLLVGQIILVFIFGMVNEAELHAVMYAGWVVWCVSCVLGWMPIFVLKRQGGVPKGKGFVHTTVLVDSGLYSIVRHPQYAAGVLFSLALILISQTWLVAAIGVVVIVLSYVDILMADKYEIEKFGDTYKRYMKEVPRINFLLGVIRSVRRGVQARKSQVAEPRTD
jgi:protein-S-isoprenylcysteine O-methyltransferase Ste14